jgi:2-polyprenyl-3-methyl-5-hydroxy-6-metoxy-1,4-benzoquinol methylase
MSRSIMAAASLGIFDALQEREDDAEGLAGRLDLDPRGVDALLVALHSMGYLDRRDGRYRNASQARKHLVSGAPQPMTETLGTFSYDMWRYMGQLEEVVRSGEPVGDLHDRPPGDPWWESYMRGLFELSQLRGDGVVRQIPTRSPRRLLDVAGGHGGFSLAMCRRHLGLEATVFDLEGAAEIGRRIMAEQDGGEMISFRVGDMFEDDLGSGYDVAMANSICHHLDREQNVELLGRIRESLAEGGTMAIVEQERPAEGKRGHQLGALTGLLFYVTSRVRTYTSSELTEFLSAAGFSEVRARTSVMVPGVVVATGRRGD